MSIKVKDKSKLLMKHTGFCVRNTLKQIHYTSLCLWGLMTNYPMTWQNIFWGIDIKTGAYNVDYQSETDIVEHISQMRFRTVLLLRGLEKGKSHRIDSHS